jgi:tetratricopeptide (TPR) repeat protein
MRGATMKTTIKTLLVLTFLFLLTGNANPAPLVNYFDSGYDKYLRGDLDGAIKDYTYAIENKPDFAQAYNNRALAKKDKGDLLGALADYNMAIKYLPSYAKSYDGRGVVKYLLRDSDAALADEEMAIKLDPTFFEPIHNRGLLKRDRGNLDGAIADFDRVVELKPDFTIAYYNRGFAKQLKGDLKGALADYAETVRQNTNFTDAYKNRGYLLYDQHDFTNSLSDFKRACELDATDNFPFFRVWLIRAKFGEIQAANEQLQTHLDDSKKVAPSDWTPNIARFLLGQLSEAELLNAAKTTGMSLGNSQQCEAFYYMGEKRLISDDNIVAIDFFEKCLATGHKEYTEYQSAAVELVALKASAAIKAAVK